MPNSTLLLTTALIPYSATTAMNLAISSALTPSILSYLFASLLNLYSILYFMILLNSYNAIALLNTCLASYSTTKALNSAMTTALTPYPNYAY
jgi:hypothetical protein